MKTKAKSRRRFFGVAIGAGLLGLFGLSRVKKQSRTTHYIGPDGKLYEVDRSKVKKMAMCAPGSKNSLRNWIERHLKNG